MSQLIYQDSYGMIHQGETALEYQTNPFYTWDPAVHEIVDSVQSFPGNWQDTIWFWVPSIGEFFTRVNDMHPFIVAASTLFTVQRWEEVEDSLEELCDVHRLLSRANFTKFRRKVQLAQSKGSITTGEATTLESVVTHFPA
jgi:hypothetical protein